MAGIGAPLTTDMRALLKDSQLEAHRFYVSSGYEAARSGRGDGNILHRNAPIDGQTTDRVDSQLTIS